MEASKLEKLPAELILGIFERLSSPLDILALTSASPATLMYFTSSRRRILVPFVNSLEQWLETPKRIPDAMLACRLMIIPYDITNLDPRQIESKNSLGVFCELFRPRNESQLMATRYGLQPWDALENEAASYINAGTWNRPPLPRLPLVLSMSELRRLDDGYLQFEINRHFLDYDKTSLLETKLSFDMTWCLDFGLVGPKPIKGYNDLNWDLRAFQSFFRFLFNEFKVIISRVQIQADIRRASQLASRTESQSQSKTECIKIHDLELFVLTTLESMRSSETYSHAAEKREFDNLGFSLKKFCIPVDPMEVSDVIGPGATVSKASGLSRILIDDILIFLSFVFFSWKETVGGILKMTFPKHLSLASRACELPECSTAERDSIRCTGCMVVRYCSAAHQALDRNRHEKGCKIVKNTRRILDMEHEILQSELADASTSESIFGDDVGYLYIDYLNARYDMVHSLLEGFGAPGGNIEAVNEALENLLDMFRRPRRQHMVVEEIVPHLYLRLNRDQEAYDFLKWYTSTVVESNCDRENINITYLDVNDADVLEEPLDVWSNGKFLTLDHVVAVTLIKVRILLDLQVAQNSFRVLKGIMPLEIIEMIRGQLIGSVLQSRPKILRKTTEEISTLIQTMKSQIIALYKSVHIYNPHFWRLMLNNETTPVRLKGWPHLRGTEDQAYQTLNYCWSSWVESHGALRLMKDLSEKV
ncbi:hypothetical protein DER45DRAFT_627423 [Fusarium avenaceum]|nr:hypothetical protein DER45DRAFT_627423 [Fusarium avenaceum]